MGYGKVGYFKNKPKKLRLDTICKRLDIKKEDIDEIITKTKFQVEGAVVYSGGKRHLFVGESKEMIKIPSCLLKNAQIIHSHPRGESFSVEDILEVILSEVESIVAFNDEYVYKMTNQTQIDYNDIKKEIVVAIDDVEDRLLMLVKNGTITQSQMGFAMNHMVWQSVSKKVKGFKYEAYAIKRK